MAQAKSSDTSSVPSWSTATPTGRPRADARIELALGVRTAESMEVGASRQSVKDRHWRSDHAKTRPRTRAINARRAPVGAYA